MSTPRSSALSSKLWMGNFDEKELAVISDCLSLFLWQTIENANLLPFMGTLSLERVRVSSVTMETKNCKVGRSDI